MPNTRNHLNDSTARKARRIELRVTNGRASERDTRFRFVVKIRTESDNEVLVSVLSDKHHRCRIRREISHRQAYETERLGITTVIA